MTTPLNITEMFNSLMHLTNTNDAFVFKDYKLDNQVYRIFSYKLPSWSDFQLPYARETRGTMFNVTDINNPVLAALPFEKFFNYNEGTTKHTNAVMTVQMEKLDGSIVSSFTHNGELRLKSNNSVFADQTVRAFKVLQLNQAYFNDVNTLEKAGYTVNFEYTAPTNQCVIVYNTSAITVLSIRSRITGQLFVFDQMQNVFNQLQLTEIGKHVVASKQINIAGADQLEFVDNVKRETIGEGYVIVLTNNDGSQYLVKVKNDKYCLMHLSRTPTSLTNERLIESISIGISDDLRAMFANDQVTVDRIINMENKVLPVVNKIIKNANAYFDNNKELPRKDFMIKANNELTSVEKQIVVNLYLGRNANAEEIIVKNMKLLFNNLLAE